MTEASAWPRNAELRNLSLDSDQGNYSFSQKSSPEPGPVDVNRTPLGSIDIIDERVPGIGVTLLLIRVIIAGPNEF